MQEKEHDPSWGRVLQIVQDRHLLSNSGFVFAPSAIWQALAFRCDFTLKVALASSSTYLERHYQIFRRGVLVAV